ncbi:hypothetical protein [Caballeronia sp. LjRoot31]|uniref:hypothetical protein n=1 Tax=Caballeronia sp. LjRoot31 TaxID=3342324 RepID=UPI003F4F7233
MDDKRIGHGFMFRSSWINGARRPAVQVASRTYRTDKRRSANGATDGLADVPAPRAR